MHPERESDGEKIIDRNEEDSVDAAMEMETIDSTESPVITYKEMMFEEKIDSEIWIALLLTAENTEKTGTEESFDTFCQSVSECMHSFTLKSDLEKIEKRHASKIRENVDEIARLERGENNWEKYTQISELREENYLNYPSLENGHQSGISALDCLDWMGKVNGKEGKRLDDKVYNEEHVLKYGAQAVDGFFGWWCAEVRMNGVQNVKEISFYFGQTFHHFGGYNDMTGDSVSVNHLLLAAAFYSQTAVDEKEIYQSGQATEKQYQACLYLAIVFDKLDNKLRPNDPFFLIEAEKYYQYALYNSNLHTGDADKIEKYIDIVRKKKKNRGV